MRKRRALRRTLYGCSGLALAMAVLAAAGGGGQDEARLDTRAAQVSAASQGARTGARPRGWSAADEARLGLEMRADRGLEPRPRTVYATQPTSEPEDSDGAEAVQPCPIPERFRAAMIAASEETGVPLNLLAAMAYWESLWQPNVVSHAGAIGVLQLMPQTARGLGVDPRRPGENIRGGARYLKSMLKRFGGDRRKAVAAYNAGPYAVAEAGWTVYPETRRYVNLVLATADIYKGCG